MLGWVAGEMMVTDPAISDWVDSQAHWLHTAAPAFGALFVVAMGKWITTFRVARVEAAQ